MNEDSMRLGRERRFLVLLGIICLALIGGALYMQIVLGEAPCPLCILQRYALLLIALSAFAGAAMRTRRSVTVFETLVVIFALAGAGTAAAPPLWGRSGRCSAAQACGQRVPCPHAGAAVPAGHCRSRQGDGGGDGAGHRSGSGRAFP